MWTAQSIVTECMVRSASMWVLIGRHLAIVVSSCQPLSVHNFHESTHHSREYTQRQKDANAEKATTSDSILTYLEMGPGLPLISLVPRRKPDPSSSTPATSLSLMVMAEIKSQKGVTTEEQHCASRSPPQQALLYVQAGASVISYSGELPWFKGSLFYMRIGSRGSDCAPGPPYHFTEGLHHLGVPNP